MRPEDSIFVGNVREIDGIFCVSRKRPPFFTRDQDNLRILEDLEIYKDALGGKKDEFSQESPRKSRAPDKDDVLLFSRNWPLTEKNKGMSLQEFILR